MKLWIPFAGAAAALVGIAMIVGADWDLPPVDSEQIGYRGVGMSITKDREKQAAMAISQKAPEPLYEPDPTGDRAKDLYENVQVLGDLSDDQFTHFMASITEWVAPEQGCAYCHNEENLASDEVYTKVVARRMIQMTQTVNVDWKAHVGNTGVTCYTCHQGKNIPVNYFSKVAKAKGAEKAGGQNLVGIGNTSMAYNALEDYLLNDKEIRVHANAALPTGVNEVGTKETEGTWSLMVHMSESLGANCTTCHNSRAFNDWDQSPPQRVTAWHGIRMAREINNQYMVGLTPVFPENRLGPEGDVFKVSCATCHNGVQKPLYGESMLKDYVDSLTVKTSDGAEPDYSTFEPGVTQVMGGGQTSDAAPAIGIETNTKLAAN